MCGVLACIFTHFCAQSVEFTQPQTHTCPSDHLYMNSVAVCVWVCCLHTWRNWRGLFELWGCMLIPVCSCPSIISLSFSLFLSCRLICIYSCVCLYVKSGGDHSLLSCNSLILFTILYEPSLGPPAAITSLYIFMFHSFLASFSPDLAKKKQHTKHSF